MTWVNLGLMPGKVATDLNYVGGWLGVMAHSTDASPEETPSKSDCLTAQYLGKRVAEITKKIA